MGNGIKWICDYLPPINLWNVWNMQSPCKNRCAYSYSKGYCLGCGRTLDDIKRWTELSDEERVKRTEEANKNMAGYDYVSCAECGKRLFYDGEWEARDYMKDAQTTKTVTCDHCVSKLKKKIETLKKRAR